MWDEALWRQIKAAPTALATVEDGLETAIVNNLRCQYKLNPVRCAIIMVEYRRFRYLCEVSESELRPPPLIRLVQARDTPNAYSNTTPNRWQNSPGWDPDWNKSSFHRDPLYQPTLDLYRQEFGLEAPPQIWPSPQFMKRQNLAWVTLIAAFGVGYVADRTGIEWVEASAVALFPLTLVYLLLHRHWADPPGE